MPNHEITNVEEEIAKIDREIKLITAKASKTLGLNYEEQALKALKRSWELEDPTCCALALQDAQIWATLHLARKTIGYRS